MTSHWIFAAATVAATFSSVFGTDSTNYGYEGSTCTESAASVRAWIMVMLLIPTVLNLASVGLLVFSMVLITRLKTVVEAISSSTHWLTRTAIRVGLGPTAKKALIEYAKTKPEFKKLVG